MLLPAFRNPMVRLHFWNPAGCQTQICPRTEARHLRRRLIAEGFVVWQSEVLD